MIREAIIDKIKKLLRMKRGGTPDEIATALRLAQELAAKHDIDLSAVNPDEEMDREQPVGHQDPLVSSRIQFECRYAGMVCQFFFNVEVFTRRIAWDRYALTFVGTEWDREIASYVFTFLVGHFRRSWKGARSWRGAKLRNRQAFMWGMYLGIRTKLRERQPKVETVQTPGLIRSERALKLRNQYIGEHFGKLEFTNVEPEGKADASLNAGYCAGRATEINMGIKSADGHSLLG